jgi:hypothetical protein
MPWVSNGSGIIDQASTSHLIGVVHNFTPGTLQVTGQGFDVADVSILQTRRWGYKLGISSNMICKE